MIIVEAICYKYNKNWQHISMMIGVTITVLL